MSNIRQLHEVFSPQTYNLNLTTHRTERRFEGIVHIDGTTTAQTDTIVLHAKELTISEATIDGLPATWKAERFDGLRLTTGKPLQPGKHEVTITFSGVITDPMNGLYPCYFKLEGKDEELLATQFESHHAREVFPCIDEPAAKAIFNLSLTTENNVTVIANTPVKNQTEAESRLTTIFEPTPIMSTYLLAWVIGKLDYLEAKTKAGVLVRTYATPGKAEKTRFALETAVRTLDFYNHYFAIDYPLAKCDMVALPDFSSGAMENWGCITYREAALLVDEHTPAGTKQYVAMVVAHELAHQWFGNLVTMQWWNDLWLNESFASWIEYLALDELFPKWQAWTQFYDSETAHALDRDSLANVQKVRQDVDDPEEIRTLFDPAIVYAKGAALLHMLHAYLGADNFRDGLRIYLKRHQYANAEADDLWTALSEVSNKDVSAFMQPWILQPGHPVLSIETDSSQLTLRQRRFYGNPKEANQQDQTVWPLPLLTQPVLSQELLTTPQTTVPSPTEKPILFNQGRTGFYLTAYSPAELEQLANQVREGQLETLDRLGLLNEAYDLARAGQQSTLQMLTLLEAYKDESSEPVWGAIASALSALRVLVNEDGALKPSLQRFVGQLTRQQFDRLGWERKPGEAYFDELLRPTIIALTCYSETPEVIEHAKKLFAQASTPEDIMADVRTSVLATNAKFGGQAAFDKLLGWHEQTSSAQIRTQLTAGLAAVRDEEHIAQLLAMLTTKAVKLQDLFYWYIYLIRSHRGRKLTWQWMQDNWSWIEKNFGNDMHFGDFPRYAAGAFSTQAELEAYRAYFMPLADNPALGRDIKQGLEAIEARVLWRERDLAEVTAYLKKFAPEPEAAARL